MSHNDPDLSAPKPEEVSRETSVTPGPSCPVCGSTGYRTKIVLQDYSVSRETFRIAECTGCGLQRTLPVPAKLEPYYESEAYISHSKTKKGIINKLYHIAQRFNLGYKYRFLPKPKHRLTIIDYGCGAGDFLKYVHDKDHPVHGVEPHEPSRKKLISQGFSVQSPEEYFREVTPADCITMWHVLEHVADPNKLLQKHRELLTEQGTLIIAVPNRESADAVTYKKYWAAYDVPRHLWHFGEKDIKHLADLNGFTLAGVHGLPLDAFYISLLSEKYRGGNFLRALTKATASNVSAALSSANYSSKVYILRKKA